VSLEHGSVDWITEEPVVEVVVDIVETGVDNPDFEQHWCRA